MPPGKACEKVLPIFKGRGIVLAVLKNAEHRHRICGCDEIDGAFAFPSKSA